jgi:sec-independent protein translocase protein TatB
MEILLIAVIAIIALGPDKLPTAMVEVAKFIKKFKSGLDDAKNTLDSELNVSEMKDQANKFKAQIEDMKTSVSSETKVDLGLNDIINDEPRQDQVTSVNASYVENTEVEKLKEENKKAEKVSFKKNKKAKETAEITNNESDKFKVKFDDEKKEDNV